MIVAVKLSIIEVAVIITVVIVTSGEVTFDMVNEKPVTEELKPMLLYLVKLWQAGIVKGELVLLRLLAITSTDVLAFPA